MAADLTTLQRDIERLKALADTESARCPYREDIGRAKNNIVRLSAAEDDIERIDGNVTDLRVEVAKIAAIGGASGGGVVAIIGGVILLVLKGSGII